MFYIFVIFCFCFIFLPDSGTGRPCDASLLAGITIMHFCLLSSSAAWQFFFAPVPDPISPQSFICPRSRRLSQTLSGLDSRETRSRQSEDVYYWVYRGAVSALRSRMFDRYVCAAYDAVQVLPALLSKQKALCVASRHLRKAACLNSWERPNLS